MDVNHLKSMKIAHKKGVSLGKLGVSQIENKINKVSKMRVINA